MSDRVRSHDDIPMAQPVVDSKTPMLDALATVYSLDPRKSGSLSWFVPKNSFTKMLKRALLVDLKDHEAMRAGSLEWIRDRIAENLKIGVDDATENDLPRITRWAKAQLVLDHLKSRVLEPGGISEDEGVQALAEIDNLRIDLPEADGARDACGRHMESKQRASQRIAERLCKEGLIKENENEKENARWKISKDIEEIIEKATERCPKGPGGKILEEGIKKASGEIQKYLDSLKRNYRIYLDDIVPGDFIFTGKIDTRLKFEVLEHYAHKWLFPL